MATIVTDTFATSMQPNPSQPHLSRGTHLLIKKVSIGSSHMVSPTGLSQVPLKQHFAFFTKEPLLSVASPIFSSFELFKCPPKGKQDISIDSGNPLYILFFCFKEESSIFWRWTIFKNGPWCFSFDGISPSTELFIKNFFLSWSPHFCAFEPPIYNPLKKVDAVAKVPNPLPSAPWIQVQETHGHICQ